jgi:hypothetical protein
MPTLLKNATPFLLMNELYLRFEAIDPGDGYNGRYTVSKKIYAPDQAPDGELPMLAVELGDLDIEGTLFQANDQDTSVYRTDWKVLVWIYVKDEYDTQLPLIAAAYDVLAAIGADETFNNEALQFEFEGARFDSKTLIDQQRGWAILGFSAKIDIDRGTTP